MAALITSVARDVSEEVRPMNAVSLWVLPLAVTVWRLT